MRNIVLSLFWLLLVACSAQETKRESGDLTRGEVEFLSARLSTEIEKEYPLLKHKGVNRYISSLGQSIVARNSDMPPLPYEFRVLKTNEIFILSLPGGVIYVSLGAIRAVNFEGQLAAGISHELAHQQLGHQLLQWKEKVSANRGQRFLLDFPGDFKDEFLGDNGALYLERGMEIEADKLSTVILYRSGFDPRLSISYLQLLKHIEQANPEQVYAIMSLHPPVKDRLEWTKEALLKLPPHKEANVSSQSFEQIKQILKLTEQKNESLMKGKQ